MRIITGVGIVAVTTVLALGGCTTTKRAAQLVIDHHVGMAQGAIDIMTGKAEEREQRVASLRRELGDNATALAAESDQSRQLELLKQHVVLQDALIAELMQGHGGHGGGHQQASAESKDEQQPPSHQH